MLPYLDAIRGKQAVGAFLTVTEPESWQGVRPGEEARHETLLALLERAPLDGAIAANADLSGYTLVTRNAQDSAALADLLPVEFYSNEPLSASTPIWLCMWESHKICLWS